MTEKTNVDTANEPVDQQDDGEFQDTGVLYEPKKKSSENDEEEA